MQLLASLFEKSVCDAANQFAIGRSDCLHAYEVEAALIDAYPGLTNLAGGHGSSFKGCRSVEQIAAAYGAAPLVVEEPLILIYVGKPTTIAAGLMRLLEACGECRELTPNNVASFSRMPAPSS